MKKILFTCICGLLFVSCVSTKVDYFGIGTQQESLKRYLEDYRDSNLKSGRDSSDILLEIRVMMHNIDDKDLKKIYDHYYAEQHKNY